MVSAQKLFYSQKLEEKLRKKLYKILFYFIRSQILITNLLF